MIKNDKKILLHFNYTFNDRKSLYNLIKKRDNMIEKLKVNAIYNDFLNSVKLTEEQKRILDMMINKDSIIKISMEIGISQRTVSYEIKKIKELFNKYYDMQLFKTEILTK